jgi:hypothetical protein
MFLTQTKRLPAKAGGMGLRLKVALGDACFPVVKTCPQECGHSRLRVRLVETVKVNGLVAADAIEILGQPS